MKTCSFSRKYALGFIVFLFLALYVVTSCEQKTDQCAVNGHTEVIDVAVPATCTETGLTEGKHCSVCNAIIVAQTVVPAKGHCPVPDEAVEATCHSTGLTAGSHCEICGLVLEAQNTIPMTNHVLSVSTIVPTCTEQGYDLHECENCDYEMRDNYSASLGHDYDDGVISIPATCVEDGILIKTCRRCSHSYTVNIPRIGGEHVFENTLSADDDYHYYKCTRCSAGTDYSEHSYDQIIVTTAPTCTTDGERTYTCSICGHVKQEVIPALGHNYSIENVVPPTCTERGYNSHVCVNCGDELRDNYTTALGHSWSTAWTFDGSHHWHACERCGLAATKLVHSFSTKVKNPTCTEDGYTRHTCQVCGYYYDDALVTKLGHNYSSKITTESTCENSGVRTFTCSRCNDKYTEAIPSLGGHIYDDRNICERCNHNKYESNFTISGTKLVRFNGAGVSGLVTIPDGIATIGANAFKDCTGLTQIIIPNSVTTIEEGAFTGCTGVSSFDIPDSVITIGTKAFARCSGISNMTIPDSVQSIGDAALYACTSLESLNLPFIGSSRTVSGTPDAVFGYVFGTNYYNGGTETAQSYSASDTGTYYIPTTLRTVNITDASSIPYGSFSGCNSLTTVSLNDGVATVDDYAFQNCSGLISVSLPSSIESKGHGLFYGCENLSGVFIVDVPAVWDTTNTHTIYAGFYGNATALFYGDMSEASYSWYIDNEDVVNVDGTPIDTDDVINFSMNEVFISLGDHILKCVAIIDGQTYTDSYHVKVDSNADIFTFGSMGHGGGYVFYDKGYYSNGWRFIEAAPADLQVINDVPTVDITTPGYTSASELIFGCYKDKYQQNLYVNGTQTYKSSNCTSVEIGTGKTNTELLVNKMKANAEVFYYIVDDSDESAGWARNTSIYASRMCDILEYSVGNVVYDDWYLPSYKELLLMYQNLKINSIGGFKNAYYWSSSEDSSDVQSAKGYSFSTGNTLVGKRGNYFYKKRYGEPSYSGGVYTGLYDTRRGWSDAYVRPVRYF